jgi:hypothetical protein
MTTGSRIFKLGGATVTVHADGLTCTRLADGCEIPAAAQDTETYRQRAAELGYGEDTTAMSREHEIGHSILAEILGLPESPTLRGVARGKYFEGWRAEEAAVLGLQAFARAAGISLLDVAERLSKP